MINVLTKKRQSNVKLGLSLFVHVKENQDAKG